jgi:hypothetical protein
MARTWLAVRVELLGGRGEELWPPPGRVFAVGPKHTFAALARAIDQSFARWDRAHLCQFLLADGRTVADEEWANEQSATVSGPLAPEVLLLDRAKVLGTLSAGGEFCYVFDFGDGWTHRCVVEPEKLDPLDRLGVVPDEPVAIWGWGAIPDQYGRRWEDDTGEDPVPPRPLHPDPMLTGSWPAVAAAPVDLAELRGAIHRHDVGAIHQAIEGRDVDECLQLVGTGVQVLLSEDPKGDDAIALSVINRLSLRAGAGDQQLADGLLAQLRQTPQAVRTVEVDLSEVSDMLEGDSLESRGGYLDLHTGDVFPDFLTDAVMVGEDAAIDVEEDPDRWVFLHRQGSREGWRDMADFAAGVRDEQTRQRLELAIEGRGAFRRFRDEVQYAGLVERWRMFSEDRQLGRAREYLAEQGISALPPPRRV